MAGGSQFDYDGAPAWMQENVGLTGNVASGRAPSPYDSWSTLMGMAPAKQVVSRQPVGPGSGYTLVTHNDGSTEFQDANGNPVPPSYARFSVPASTAGQGPSSPVASSGRSPQVSGLSVSASSYGSPQSGASTVGRPGLSTAGVSRSPRASDMGTYRQHLKIDQTLQQGGPTIKPTGGVPVNGKPAANTGATPKTSSGLTWNDPLRGSAFDSLNGPTGYLDYRPYVDPQYWQSFYDLVDGERQSRTSTASSSFGQPMSSDQPKLAAVNGGESGSMSARDAKHPTLIPLIPPVQPQHQSPMGSSTLGNRTTKPFLPVGQTYQGGALDASIAYWKNRGMDLGSYAGAMKTSLRRFTNVDPKLLTAVIYAESSGNLNSRSHVGAAGLMQLMPNTWADNRLALANLGIKVGSNDYYNVNDNILEGAYYLSRLLREFNGSVDLALAAYNAGPGAVKKYGGVPPFPETQLYIRRIKAAIASMGESHEFKALTGPINSVGPVNDASQHPASSSLNSHHKDYHPVRYASETNSKDDPWRPLPGYEHESAHGWFHKTSPSPIAGLHPDAYAALREAGIPMNRIVQTIGHARASAGTHAKESAYAYTGTPRHQIAHPYSAAVDISVRGMSPAGIRSMLHTLGLVGFAAWYRDPGYDGWPRSDAPHIHAVYAGVEMKPILQRQISDYVHGRNGLRGHQKYRFYDYGDDDRDTVRQLYGTIYPGQNL